MGKVVLVGSQSGDIGKSIICIKLGFQLSQMGKKVLLLDLSLGKKKISEYLNVSESIIYDIKDVLDGICSLDQAIVDVSENLWLLPSPRLMDKLKDVKFELFGSLIKDAKDYDVIIVDVDKVSLSYIDFSTITNIVTVNNNDFSSIKKINQDKMIAQKNNVAITTIINKYNKNKAKNGSMMNVKDIQKMTELNINAVIDDISAYDGSYYFLSSTQDNSFNKAINILLNQI